MSSESNIGIQAQLRPLQNATYPDRLGPSGKHFCTLIVLYLFMA